MKFLMPDSCVIFHVLGKFHTQMVYSFPREKLRKKSTLLHTKNFSLEQDVLWLPVYSNGKSWQSTDCTPSTVILHDIFADAMARPLEIWSFSCPSMCSLWREMWLLFCSQICFPFCWEQEVWDQSVRHSHCGQDGGDYSTRAIKLRTIGDSLW